MPLLAIAASHVHLMDYEGLVAPETMERVQAALERHKRLISDFDPELVFKIGDDHASGFSLSLMPPFTVGVRARGVGDFNCSSDALSTDEALAREFIAYSHRHGVDVAHSYRMRVDHGVTQLLEHYFGGVDRIPVIPIVVNCGGDLRPPLSRTRRLGGVIGEFCRERLGDRRVLVVGSGGLSHDPPLPVFVDSPPEVQEKLIEGTPRWTDDIMQARVERVIAAAEEHGRGEGPLRPLNPDWDRQVLDLFAAGDLDAICAMDDAQIVREGGRGASEIRNWIASVAAAEAYGGGSYAPVEDFYEEIPGWIVGLGMMHVEAIDARN